ncbi:MAG: NADH-quinone oxidoreductase subunit C [bacterium]|nr:NADH-quinone oxidoreductase subunit C [bacterium]
MEDGARAAELVREKFPDAVRSHGSECGQHWVELETDHVLEVCAWLRDDESTQFDYLVDVTAVHWPEQESPMQVVYHLCSYARNDRLRVKTPAADKGPVPSLTGLWLSAAWNERETYDMFGIRFEGHPDLRRILMPDDYTDFPLRKEFPLYRG